MRGRAWVLLASVLSACTATSTVEVDSGSACLRVPWDAFVGEPFDGGVTDGLVRPPNLMCQTTVECPPPLICVRPADAIETGGIGTCELASNTIAPNAAIRHYGVGEFTTIVEQRQGADYTTVSFSSLPPDAAFVRCAVHNCPIDEDVLALEPSRCLIDQTVISLANATSISLPSATRSNGPAPLALSPTPGCTRPDCTDNCETRDLPVPSAGFYMYCLAYSRTALVGASSVINLEVAEIGQSGESAYVSQCEPRALTYQGVACAYEQDDGTEILGVCRQTSCCLPCWTQEQCTRRGGTACVLIDSTASDDPTAPPLTPFIGYCRGRCQALDQVGMGDSGMTATARDAGMMGNNRDGGLPARRPDAGLDDDLDAGDEVDGEPDGGLPDRRLPRPGQP